MHRTPVRRIASAAALLLAGLSVGSPVAAQEASPSAAPAAVQTTQPVEQQDTNDFPWGLLGLLGLAGLAGLRRRDAPQVVRTVETEGAKTYTQR